MQFTDAGLDLRSAELAKPRRVRGSAGRFRMRAVTAGAWTSRGVPNRGRPLVPANRKVRLAAPLVTDGRST